MKCFAGIDTNVLVSAMLNWDSIPACVIELALGEIIVPLLHENILKEYREVLLRPKFHFEPELVDTLLASIEKAGIYVSPTEDVRGVLDPGDEVFYAVTMEARKGADARLVTDNIGHFPRANYVVTPREMVEIVLGDDGSLDGFSGHLGPN